MTDAAAASSSGRSIRSPSRSHQRTDSREQPEAHDVVQESHAPVDAALVREVRQRARHPSSPDARARRRRGPTCRTRCRRPTRRASARRRRRTPCRAIRPRRPRCPPGAPRSAATCGRRPPIDSPGSTSGAKTDAASPSRSMSSSSHSPDVHADEARRRRVRALGHLRARELEADQVGHEQQGIGEVEASARVSFDGELVDRVERQELQAVAAVEPVERDDRGARPRRRARCARRGSGTARRAGGRRGGARSRRPRSPRRSRRPAGSRRKASASPRVRSRYRPGEVPVQARREPHGVVREPRDVVELERARPRRRRGRG